MKLDSICFVISSLKGHGGMERVSSLIGNLFIEKGYNVMIVTRDDDSYFEHSFPLSKNVEIRNYPGNLFSFLKNIQGYVKKNKPKYVVSHNMGKMSLALSLVVYRKYGTQFISFEHVANISAPKYVQFLKKILYKRVDKVVVLSKEDERNYNDFHSNVNLVSNPSPFSIQTGKEYDKKNRTIISLGRLTHQKGYDMFLKSWALIEKRYPDWSVNVYGQGEDIDDLCSLKRELGIERFNFKGLSKNTSEVYSNGAFFVMSSRFEGFGMVLIESHSFGVPTISFDCPFGPGDIIKDAYNGLLIENGNIDELAKGIERFILDEDLRERCSIQALSSVEKYSLDNIWLQWESLLQKEI